MATLVLGAVGTIIGGPIGAAIGSLIGNQIDQAIFAPNGSEGPRLQDLKVQASTYGQAIPQLFGTMRVAGSVIWASDFVERAVTSGGGKRRPEVTQYSYYASLAVALSSRAIRNVRRVWADGNLLRGSNGRLYETGEMRVHKGGPDQEVDPLIAAAVGLHSASAFRGLSYVVFEGLELSSFGNRIPSLTFEVEADVGAVDSGVIGNALLGEAERCVGRWPIEGYAASGDRVRDAVAPLWAADRAGVSFAQGDWRLVPPELAGPAQALSAYSQLGREESRGDMRERRRQALAGLPASVSVRHYERERDYQAGQQASIVAGGGGREERIDLPAVLSAASARSLAAWLAAAASDGRETLLWQGDFAALALPIGNLVLLEDGSRWRVAGRIVRDDQIMVELCRHQRTVPAALLGEPGEAVIAPEWPDPDGVLRIFDLPNMEYPAATAPRILLAGASRNGRWRGADCWFVGAEEGEPLAVGRLRGAAAMGELVEPLPIGSAWVMDKRHKLVVRLEHEGMTLETVDSARLFAGGNRAMVGGEMLQFAEATLVLGPESDGRTWILSGLLRARCGAERGGAHPAGTGFVLLDDGALQILPDSLARRAVVGGAHVQWAERGDAQMQQCPIPTNALALRPLSPVHGRWEQDGVGGITLSWIARSRANLGWRDEIDLPVGEAVPRWRVGVEPPVAGIGPWEVNEARLRLDASVLAALPEGAWVKIAQIGDHALSPSLQVWVK